MILFPRLNFKKVKILITGPTGFIGKHLIDELLKDKHSIVAIEKKNAETSFLQSKKIPIHYYNGIYVDLHDVFLKEKPEGVIHLASLFLVNHTSDQITDLVKTNILFPVHLLESAVNSQTKWFINTGTFWQHFENRSYSPVNLYASTKQAFEDIARFYYETKNINFVTLKLSDTFGPDDNRPKILNLWMKHAFSGDILEMSPGNQLIDISYIENVIDGFKAVMNLISTDYTRRYCGKYYALKSEKVISLKALAEIFQKETGRKLNILWGKREYKQREVMIPWQNGDVIPNWKPRIGIEEGIRLYYNYYKEKFKQ